MLKTANAIFQLLEPVQSHMCALPAIRAFSFFFFKVVWDGTHPVQVLEFQFACKFFESSYPARDVMIVPENRVVMAPRDWEELMNSTIIHSHSHLCPKSSHCHQRHLHTLISHSSSYVSFLFFFLSFFFLCFFFSVFLLFFLLS